MYWWIAIVGVTLLTVRRFWFGYPAAPAKELVVLAPREVAFIDATADVLFPSGGAIPLSGEASDLPGYVDRFLASLRPRLRWQIRALFLLVEQATIFFPAPGITGFRRFSSLGRKQRIAVLQGWTESRFFLRQILFTALRAVFTMGYLGHPDVMRFLRVAPYDFESPICEADLLFPPIGAHPNDNPLGPADLTPPSDGTPIDIEGPLHPDFAGEPL